MKICTNCKIARDDDQFISKAGRTGLKNCLRCRNIKRNKPCPHGRQKCRCIECKGVSICPHNRRETECKDCDGKYICEHNKIKYTCVDCEGNSICEHKKYKSQCKDCIGGSVCEHDKLRSSCKICGSYNYCVHNRRKHYCIECGGKNICQHNRIKHACRKCGDANIILFKSIIHHSKWWDIKKNRFDESNFIDIEFLQSRFNESHDCYHCKREMTLIDYTDSLCTIQRLDNSLGHTKSNSVLACLKCNLQRKEKA